MPKALNAHKRSRVLEWSRKKKNFLGRRSREWSSDMKKSCGKRTEKGTTREPLKLRLKARNPKPGGGFGFASILEGWKRGGGTSCEREKQRTTVNDRLQTKKNGGEKAIELTLNGNKKLKKS